jgi:hypothetical protein
MPKYFNKLFAYVIIIVWMCLNGCKPSTPTFSKHIAPIIYKHCTPCHRPNQIGHINLLTYEQIAKNAKAISYTVRNKIMPPWPADPNYRHFVNENYLSQQQIELITQWVDNNCPIGDSTHLPAIPTYNYTGFYGKPDIVIPIKPITIKGDFKDQFLTVKVPFELPQGAYARLIEFVPGNTSVLHHINSDLVRFTEGKKKNIYDGNWVANTVNDSTIKQVYARIGLLHDDGSYPTLHRNAANYLPGVIAQQLPAGIGNIYLGTKNAFLLSDIHYGPSSKLLTDSTSINIYLSKVPPKRAIGEFQLGTIGVSPVLPRLYIPADSIMQVYSQYIVPNDISILLLNPHMHLIGKSFKAFAVPPAGDTIPLVHIPQWDFNWQNYYKPLKPIVLKKGTTIFATGIYDNTSGNRHNPNKPPIAIHDNNGSMRTTDEMFQLMITYMLYQQGDEAMDLKVNGN